MSYFYEKEFDWWNIVKKMIDSKNADLAYPQEGEIWWCALGSNVGAEIDGKNKWFERPVLIIKRFNRDMVWIVPSTSKNKAGKYYYKYSYRNKTYHLILSQLKTISTKRTLRKIGVLTHEQLLQIKVSLTEILNDETPPHEAGNLGARRRNG